MQNLKTGIILPESQPLSGLVVQIEVEEDHVQKLDVLQGSNFQNQI